MNQESFRDLVVYANRSETDWDAIDVCRDWMRRNPGCPVGSEDLAKMIRLVRRVWDTNAVLRSKIAGVNESMS